MPSNNAPATSAAAPQPRALVDAARLGDTEAVRDLLARGADVNERGTLGDTALIWAAWRENREIVCLLLDHGADIDAENDLRMKAMDYVTRDNKAEMAALLNGAAERRAAAKTQVQARDEAAERSRALHDTAARRQENLRAHAPKLTIRPV